VITGGCTLGNTARYNEGEGARRPARRNRLVIKLTDEEMEETRELARRTGKPMSEVWRAFRDFSRIFYSELTLSDALVINERTLPLIKFLADRKLDMPLCECMRPFNQLVDILEAKRVLEAEAELRREKLRKAGGTAEGKGWEGPRSAGSAAGRSAGGSSR